MPRAAVRLFVGLSLLLLLGAGTLQVLRSGPTLPLDFVDATSSQEVSVEIPTGATGSQIAKLLFSVGVTRSIDSFFQLAVTDSRSAQIAPGVHRLGLAISAKSALDQLLDPGRIPNLVKIIEGQWTSEITSQLVKQGFTRSDVMGAIKSLDRPPKISGNEGIFFPAQYSFASGTGVGMMLQSMVERFAGEAKAAGVFSGVGGFSPMQLLTIASLIQAEGDVGDFPKISQVIRNRLKIGMPLQFDTTVHYIKKSRGQVFLSTKSTQIASPFNTYLHYGLPPGPINNPGRAAMNAAVTPEMGDWLYFLTVAPGDTRFTRSHDRFLVWKNIYEKNLKAGLFGVRK